MSNRWYKFIQFFQLYSFGFLLLRLFAITWLCIDLKFESPWIGDSVQPLIPIHADISFSFSNYMLLDFWFCGSLQSRGGLRITGNLNLHGYNNGFDANQLLVNPSSLHCSTLPAQKDLLDFCFCGSLHSRGVLCPMDRLEIWIWMDTTTHGQPFIQYVKYGILQSNWQNSAINNVPERVRGSKKLSWHHSVSLCFPHIVLLGAEGNYPIHACADALHK